MPTLEESLEQFGNAFQAFKEQTKKDFDDCLKSGDSDIVTKESVETINTTLTELQDQIKEIQTQNARPNADTVEHNGKQISEDQKKHINAFTNFLRKGDNRAKIADELMEAQEKGMKVWDPIEEKNVNITTPGDGGYAVPEVLGRQIMDRMVEVSELRPWCRVITVMNEDYRELHNRRGTNSGWVDEDDARPETDTSTLVQVTPYMGEIYANPAATQTSIEDLFFDVGGWIVDETALAFAVEEGEAVVNGDGSKKPRGFLDYSRSTDVDSARAFGTLEKFASVKASQLYDVTKVAATDTDGHQAFINKLIDMAAAFKKQFRPSLAWYCNRLVESKIRKLRNVDGDLMWQPDLRTGSPGSILGYPVRTLEAMPNEGASNPAPLALAAMNYGYTIVDRVGMSTLRDPFVNKPYVHFYSRKRCGGMVSDSEAIKLLELI